MDFCLLAYSDQFHFHDMAFDYLALMQELCSQFDIKFTHIYYSLVTDQENDEIWDDPDELQEEIPFNPESLNRLGNVLKTRQVSTLSVWSRDEKNPASPARLTSEVLESIPIAGNKLYVQFPLERLENLDFPARFSFVSNLLSLINRLGRLDYALGTVMLPQLPQMYFRDAFAPAINEPQAVNLAMWIRRYGEHRLRLRGLYWGNLLGRDHLLQLADAPVFKLALEKIVGSDRLAAINGDDLFFMLPSSDPASSPQFAAVRQLLIDNDLLMQPTEKDVKLARQYFSMLHGAA